MSDEVSFVDDDSEGDEHPNERSVPWAWLGAGVALGLAVGILFLGPAVGGEPEPAGVTNSPLLAESPEDPPGLDDALPGFPDALVSVVQRDGRTLDHVIWPLRGPSVKRPLPVGDFGDSGFDVSGRWLALTTLVPEDGTSLLFVGQAPNVAPLAYGVTGFAWHDSRAASLAYTRQVEGESQLWVVGSDRQPRLVAAGADLGPVAAWGEWGFALQVGEGLLLLNGRGDLKDWESGTVLDSHPSGWLLVVDQLGLKLVSAGGGVRRLRIATELGEPLAGLISPDFERIAIVASDGLLLSPIDGEPEDEMFFEPHFRYLHGALVWSSDSRFVLIPTFRGIYVVGVDPSFIPRAVLDDRLIRSVGLIPSEDP